MSNDNPSAATNSSQTINAPKTDSQTASEYIDSQLALEAEAREALPYSFDHCTQPLGPLKQNIYSCLTCNPSPKDSSVPYNAAGVCYGCSIACHGEHTLVELFAHRNFTCDCGTTRMPATSPCTLRIKESTGMKEPVHSEEASAGNTYNHNFKNYFCGCGELYDAHKQKGTMYQCIGLATEQEGGCGEDWWHPECLIGWKRDWFSNENGEKLKELHRNEDKDEHPVPPGFPEDFETLICYKCVNSNPWIKKYVAADGFMAIPYDPTNSKAGIQATEVKTGAPILKAAETAPEPDEKSQQIIGKRKADDETSDAESTTSKRIKVDAQQTIPERPKHAALPPAPIGKTSIVTTKEEWRSEFCQCPSCYPDLARHPQLLEEEEIYEPPVSEDGEDAGPGSVGTGSLLERGEAALSNVDRVRAIEGVMVYNNLRDKVKSFLKPFAESGETVSADHIKAYFEKLRGDDQAMREAAAAANKGDSKGGGSNGDSRTEQRGF